MAIFDDIFNGRNVLVTGHTGFKGSWLSLWLKEMGAQVIGYSLPPPTDPSNFQLSKLERFVSDNRGDIRDFNGIQRVIDTHRPELVFHLAAQPIVIDSYKDPRGTMETNVGGTVNLLEVLRKSPFIKAVVVVTSDKCYLNKGIERGYHEKDALGGNDPYSASKAMAEIAVSAFNESFFLQGPEGVAVASARAGNVIGGGDFAKHRLVPDCVRALMDGVPIEVRNPDSVRPFQYVLEPLSGYLSLASYLLREGRSFSGAWNFGPAEKDCVSVKEMVEKAIKLWGKGSWNHVGGPSNQYKEACILRLNSDKAAQIQWRPVLSWDESLSRTIDWFKKYERGEDMHRRGVEEIGDYCLIAKERGLDWAV